MVTGVFGHRVGVHVQLYASCMNTVQCIMYMENYMVLLVTCICFPDISCDDAIPLARES